MSNIKKLEIQSIQCLCNGQVVSNLASLIKELIENSIDASATIIDVTLEDQGITSIKVVDNGTGIDKVNFDFICLPNYTSKIENYTDVTKLNSLGFRGEALAAISNMSNIIITTRTEKMEYGNELTFNNDGELIHSKIVARKVGTTIYITNIFENFPVRKKELMRNIKREYTKCINLFNRYAVLIDEIKFILNSTNSKNKTNKCVSFSKQNYDSFQNIVDVCGTSQTKNLLKVDYVCEPDYESESHIEKIVGYISHPLNDSAHNSAHMRQFLSINNRPCKITEITTAINNVYNQIGFSRNPFFLLKILINCEKIDVNLTPDKSSILVDGLDQLIDLIRHVIVKELTVFVQKKECPIENSFRNLNSTINSDGNADSLNLDFSRDNSSILNSTMNLVNKYGGGNIRDDYDEQNVSKLDLVTGRKFKPELNLLEFFKSNNEFSLPKKRKCEVDAKNNESGNVPFQFDLNHFNVEISPKKIVGLNKSCHINDAALKPVKIIENYENCTGSFRPSLVSKIDTISESVNVDSNGLVLKGIDQSNDKINILSRTLDMNRDNLPDLSVNGLERIYKRSVTNEIEDTFEAIESQFYHNLKDNQCNEASENLSVSPGEGCIIPAIESINILLLLGCPRYYYCFARTEKYFSVSFGDYYLFNRGFILAKLDNNVYLIDQHASDEIYNFENTHFNMTSQILIKPIIVEIGSFDKSIISEYSQVFVKNGFNFSLKNESALLNRIPEYNGQIFNENDFKTLVELISESSSKENVILPKIRDIFATKACRKSIMIGDPLNFDQMQKIIKNLGTLKSPWNCPHGRPTIRHLMDIQNLVY
ncbi:hypothetical protein A3Q56_00556 [Intoshia linei]|uniref:Uncharacterized protein n=1 Tax=Intoshia linei TaxID=1819745 RepID=A0A177BBG7_9BILA|nr:hypothetical protein A3Q56_00556 [Intoshia linei]